MICPQCHTGLQIDKHPNGALWQCPQCSGVAANLAVLRKQLQPQIVLNFWKEAYTSKTASRGCPSCRQALNTFSCTVDNHTVYLDLCKKCQIVWFDKGELDAFPKHVVRMEDLSPEAKKQLALYQVRYGQELPDEMDPDVGNFNWMDVVATIMNIVIRIALRL